MEIELSNGTILDLPDGTPPEAARNYAIRAEAKLKGAADNQAARDQQQAAPAEPTNMFGGTPLLDRFGLKGLREGASSVLNTETGIPAFIGRGALSRNPLVGGADLAATGINMAARGTPLDAAAPGSDVFGAPDLGVLAARGGPPVQLPIPSQVIGNAIGLKQQDADTGTAEKVLESIISFGRSGTPLATGAAGVRAASPMVQRGANLAVDVTVIPIERRTEPLAVLLGYGAKRSRLRIPQERMADRVESLVPYCAELDRPLHAQVAHGPAVELIPPY